MTINDRILTVLCLQNWTTGGFESLSTQFIGQLIAHMVSTIKNSSNPFYRGGQEEGWRVEGLLLRLARGHNLETASAPDEVDLSGSFVSHTSCGQECGSSDWLWTGRVVRQV